MKNLASDKYKISNVLDQSAVVHTLCASDKYKISTVVDVKFRFLAIHFLRTFFLRTKFTFS